MSSRLNEVGSHNVPEPRDDSLLKSAASHWPIFVVVLAASMIALIFVIASLTPKYTADAMLLLPSDPKLELVEQNISPSAPQTDVYLIKGYVDTLKSSELIRQVIQNLHLSREPEFQPRQSRLSAIKDAVIKAFGGSSGGSPFTTSQINEERIYRQYVKNLSVKNEEHSLVISLAFQAEDPFLAAKIVNAHAAAYIAAQVAYRQDQAKAKTAWLDTQLAVAAREVSAAQVALQKHPTTIGRGLDSAADQAAELKSLQAGALAKANVYDALLRRRMIMVAEQRYDGSDTRIVSKAVVPTIAQFPNIPLFLIAALLVSSLLAFFAALLASKFRSPTPGEIAKALGLRSPEVLCLPGAFDFARTKSARRTRRLRFWEQIRSIRSLVARGDHSCDVLAVVSPEMGSGASVVAASLARAFASTGSRTLLIDMDVRSPSAHNLLGLRQSEQVGIGEVLAGTVEPHHAMLDGGLQGSLDLLTPSIGGVKNVDALAGARMANVVAMLRKDYETIVIDTPALELGSEVRASLALADSALIVAPSQGKQAHLKEAVAFMRRDAAGVALKGVIFTSRGGSLPQLSKSQLMRLSGDDSLSKLAPMPTGLPLKPFLRRIKKSRIRVSGALGLVENH